MADEKKVVLNWQGSAADAEEILLALPQSIDVTKGQEGDEVTLMIVVMEDSLNALRDSVDGILESVGSIDDR
jgi:hypothetical protein